MIKFTIPLPPISKKNSQRIFRPNGLNRPVVVPSAAYKRYENEAALYLPRGVFINKPVNIKCLFYLPTRRKCDLTNLLEAIDDVLVKAGLLADDNYTIIESHDGSRVYYDKDKPRTEIYIEESATGNTNDVIYLCDKKQCKNCSFPDCAHTTDIKHAKNFENRYGVFVEKRKDERNYYYED